MILIVHIFVLEQDVDERLDENGDVENSLYEESFVEVGIVAAGSCSSSRHQTVPVAGDRIVVDHHRNLVHVSRVNERSVIEAQKEIDWVDEGGHGDRDEEEEDIVDIMEVRQVPVERRVLRSDDLLLSPLTTYLENSRKNSHCASSNSGQTSNSSANLSAAPAVNEEVALEAVFVDAVDARHGELLGKVNQLIGRLASLKHLLSSNPEKESVVYLHLLEEQIILAREAELTYLRTSAKYRHSYNKRVADNIALLPKFPSRIKHVRDAISGKWPNNPMTDEWIQQALGADLHKYPVNINDLVDSTEGSNHCTLGNFHSKLNDLCASNNVTTQGRNAIVTLLVQETSLNLGVRRHPTTNNIIHTSGEYLKFDPRAWFVDCCINQCTLFVGEFGELIRCPKCNTPRFSKCNYGGKCQYGIECSPFVNLSHKYRTSNQIMTYRYARCLM